MSSSQPPFTTLPQAKRHTYRDLRHASNRANASPMPSPQPQFRADGGSNHSHLAPEINARQASFEAFRAECQDRQIPLLSMDDRNNSDNTNGRTSNIAPVAHMYGAPPIASQYHAPMARMTNNLLNNWAASSHAMGASPYFNPNASVQPYGNLTRQDGQQRPAQRRAPPMRNVPSNSGSHVAMPNNAPAAPSNTDHPVYAAAANLVPPVQKSRATSHIPHGSNVPIGRGDGRADEQASTLQDILAATNKLTYAIETRQPFPHESSTPLVAPASIARPPYQPGQPFYGPFPTSRSRSASMAAPPDAQGIRAKPQPPVPKIGPVPPRRQPKPEVTQAPLSSDPSPAPQTEQHNVMDTVQSHIPPAQAGAHESDADAEGDTDDDFFPDTAYTAANGMAQKAPRNTQAKPKIKLKLRVKNASDPDFEPEPDAPELPQIEKQPAKPRAGRKPVARAARKNGKKKDAGPAKAPVKQVVIPVPQALQDKAQPTDVTDLFALIAFETANYNQDPERQNEIKAINEKIRNANNTYRSKKELEELKANGREGLREKPKRKGSFAGADAVKPKTKAKARKTKKAGNRQASPFVVPDDEDGEQSFRDDTTMTEDDDYDGTTALEDDLHDSPFDESDWHGPAQVATNIHMLPLRPLKPAPGSFVFDADGNALPNPNYRRGQPEEGRKLRPRDEIVAPNSTPLREKVVYVPKSLDHLVKRIAKHGAEAAPAHQSTPSKTPNSVAVPEPAKEKSFAEQVMDIVSGASPKLNIAMTGVDSVVEDAQIDRGHEGGDSDLDAEGETD